MGGDMIGDFLSAESKLPLVAVAADFQKSPQILMSHPGVGLDKWEDLSKAKPVYVGAGAINTFYAWLRLVYGFRTRTSGRIISTPRPLSTNEIFDPAGLCDRRALRDRKAGRLQTQRVPALRLRLFDLLDPDRDAQGLVEKRPDLVQRFVDASAIGWYHYLYGDNSKANAAIKTENPDITDDEIAFSIDALKKYGVVDSGDTLTLGIGAMTDAHWKDFFDEMVKVGMVKADTDYKNAYTLKFVNKGVGLDLRPK